jgi:hypothetical protein
LYKIKHIEIHTICHIDKEISMDYDTTGEVLNTKSRQLLMDEVDVEGEPLFGRSNVPSRRTLIAPSSWNPTTTYVNISLMTTNQRKNQQQVKFAAYAKIIVKKLCVVNPNEATDNFAYAPSRPEKRCITVSYVAEIAPPAYIPEFMDPIAENIDLTVDEPSLLMGSVNATKLMELERSIRSIEIDR